MPDATAVITANQSAIGPSTKNICRWSLPRMSSRIAITCESILNFPSGEAAITTPREYATPRSTVTANSRPRITSTIQAGARSICTSESSAAVMRSLSASGSMS